jgi:GT2 family glycosyltransferase
MPLVSVIIPTYNRWPMLRDAVASVLTQTFKNFELIIVDDGSTDETAHELAQYGASLRLVAQHNRGVAAARNAGVRVAKGEYIAFLDSDDLWLPKKLEVQTAFMQRNEGIDICQTEETWIRRGIRVNPRQKHHKPAGNIFRPSLDLCLVSPSAVMMTRRLFQETGGFDETFRVCEDYDLWLRIAVNYPVALVPAALVVKRGGHSDQLSRSIWGLDRFRIAALQKLLRLGLDEQRKNWAVEVLTQKVSILAHGARKRGKDQDALRYAEMLAEFPSGR